MRLRKRVVTPGAALALTLAGWLCFGPPYARHAERAPSLAGRAPDRSIAAAREPRHAAARVPPDPTAGSPPLSPAAATRPASLSGTEIDGGFALDPSGAFLPGPEALRLFDYFLSATGEESLDVIRARIEYEIFRRLSGSAATQAVALLDRYLAYREAARQLAESGAAPSGLDRRVQWLRELRREHFGAGLAGALFGDEEEVTLIDLEQWSIRAEEYLSNEVRAARIEQLASRLPAAVWESRRVSGEPARVHQRVAALRNAGADEREVFAERERAFGREAAERLAALDGERALWHERLDRYASQRDAILADEGLSDLERREAIDALRSSSFDGRELVRVRLLDAAR